MNSLFVQLYNLIKKLVYAENLIHFFSSHSQDYIV